MYLAGSGKIPMEQVVPIADGLVQLGGLGVAASGIAWGYLLEMANEGGADRYGRSR
jgi:hypothetical protein